MLLIDGQKADINGNSPFEKDLAKKKQLLTDTYGWPVVFEFPKSLFKKTITGSTESPCAKRLSPRIPFNSENGAEEIIYCKRFWKDSNENIVMFPNKIVIDKVLSVSIKDWDLAVYLAFFSPSIGRAFVILNKKKTASDLNKLNRDRRDITNFIFASKAIEKEFEIIDGVEKEYVKIDGVISKGKKFRKVVSEIADDPVNRIAVSYGIHSDNFQVLQNKLLEAVEKENSTTKEGFSTFLAIIKDEKKIAINANIHLAIKENLIRSFPDKGMIWSYLDHEAFPADLIMRYKVNPLRELSDFLNANSNVYGDLCLRLGDNCLIPKKEKKTKK